MSAEGSLSRLTRKERLPLTQSQGKRVLKSNTNARLLQENERLDSKPGETRFEIKLPFNFEALPQEA